MKRHAFTLWLVVAVALAVLFPELASDSGPLPSSLLTRWGVAVIFFLLGLSIPYRELVRGYSPLRLHLFVCGWNYILFPILVFLVLLGLSSIIAKDFRLGFMLLAIMPTTIASAVTFTELSGGQTSNAIFSTVSSNLLAIVIVPTYSVFLFSTTAAAEIPYVTLLVKIAVLILLPLLVGQVCRRLFCSFANLLKPFSKRISSAIILFIVYAAFASSARSNSLSGIAVWELFVVGLLTVVILVVVSYLTWCTSPLFKLDKRQRIAAFYCASQKSLATGLPIAVMVLATVPSIGDPARILIPLILFHPLQLVLAGVLSKRFAS